jgi:broad specificity phosphatase PhoE
MLYLIHHGEAVGDLFESALTSVGMDQVTNIAAVMQLLNIQCIYTAPYMRALDTILPYVHDRKTHNHFCRVEAHYELHNPVLLPEHRPKPLSLDVVMQYKMNRQSVLGTVPGPENYAEFQRRIIDWFDNEFFQKYKDAPIPTAIVADSMTLGTIMYYLMARKPYNLVRDKVMALKPGSIVEFKSDGLRLEYSRQIE